MVIATPQSALPPACPERGFEPSAPGGRCSEGRIGRNREYCKQQRSKTTIFQPALWMRAKRADGGVAARLLLFASTPQSRLTPCQLPGRGAFWAYLQALILSLPVEGGGFCEAKDGGIASGLLLFASTPQSNLRFASSPSGEPFGFPPTEKSPIGALFIACLFSLILISSRSRCSCRGQTGQRRGHSPRAGSCCRNSRGNSSRSSSRSRGRSPWGRCWSGTW